VEPRVAEVVNKWVVKAEYAVESRYPDDFYLPGLDEAQRAMRLAGRVKQFIIDRWKADSP
jgi:hypothetical protein